MDRTYGFAVYCIVVGLSFVLFRHWWVRDRTDFLRRGVRFAIGERMRQKADARARWYETHPAEAERLFVYIGLAFIVVETVALLVRWNPLGMKSPFTAHAPHPPREPTEIIRGK